MQKVYRVVQEVHTEYSLDGTPHSFRNIFDENGKLVYTLGWADKGFLEKNPILPDLLKDADGNVILRMYINLDPDTMFDKNDQPLFIAKHHGFSLIDLYDNNKVLQCKMVESKGNIYYILDQNDQQIGTITEKAQMLVVKEIIISIDEEKVPVAPILLSGGNL